MDGRRQEFRIRFNQPVDHGASRLEVVRAETVLRSLRPRLGASPDTLYANTGGLPPGDYVLRWTAWSSRGGAGLMGDLAFSVR
ncbi:copper resistance protein CopC [Roseomonas sp. CCTCC AB2023176]|uniref:copper resistance protein CopC n=1 Tax=Roseomonas sp. CCTCC AB2023176 TaxID=3342640 RepID=UPI0035DA2831